MWEVDNRTPFACAGYFSRDRRGAEHWVVAVVSLFRIRPDGRLVVAGRQAEPLLAPLYKDSDAAELRLDADLAPFRPRVDVLLEGIARRADGGTLHGHEVCLRIGAMVGPASPMTNSPPTMLERGKRMVASP